ncbi:hypothetical protein ACXET9_11485 [Brachybacterium sp. DNPG3]
MADQSADRWDDRDGRGGRDGRSPQERGFSGPDGVENADRILELEREERRDAATRADFAPDFPRDLGEEDLAAAEQGNRDGDEMTSDGDDPYEAAELSGDADDDTDEYADPDAYGRPRPGFRIEDPSRHGERR